MKYFKTIDYKKLDELSFNDLYVELPGETYPAIREVLWTFYLHGRTVILQTIHQLVYLIHVRGVAKSSHVKP